MANQQKNQFMTYEEIAKMALGSYNVEKYPVKFDFWEACATRIGRNDEQSQANIARQKKELEQVLKAPKLSPKNRAATEELIKLLDQIEIALQNPYEEYARAFLDRTLALTRLRSGLGNSRATEAEQLRLMTLNKIKQFSDEDAKYHALRFFVENEHTEKDSIRIAIIMRANSPLATPQDLIRAQKMPDYRAHSKAIFEQVERVALHNLNTEIVKEAPDLGTIRKSLEQIIDSARLTGDGELCEQTARKYTFENLMTKDPAYVLADPAESRLAEIDNLHKQLDEMRQQMAAKEQEIVRVQQQLENEQQLRANDAVTAKTNEKQLNDQIERMRREANKLREENSKLGQAKTLATSKLQRLIQGAQQMKSGIGSRGVKNYQKLVSEVTNENIITI